MIKGIFKIKNDGVFKLFIEEVAEKGLLRYEDIIQYGQDNDEYSKAGETLYTHKLKLVLLLESLQSILKLKSEPNNEEKRVIFTSIIFHDINKLTEYQEINKKFGYKAVVEKLNEQIEIFNLKEKFFPNIDEYYNDIKFMMLGHSEHNGIIGSLIDLSVNNTKIPKDRLSELLLLLRAVDQADLCNNINETYKRNYGFLYNINAFLNNPESKKRGMDKQYKLEFHKLSENIGILSDIISFQTYEHIKKEYKALPCFFYPEGCWYLIESDKNISFTEENLKDLSTKIRNKIMVLKSDLVWKLIGEKLNQGIKTPQGIEEIINLEPENISNNLDEWFNHVFLKVEVKKRNYDKNLKGFDGSIEDFEKAELLRAFKYLLKETKIFGEINFESYKNIFSEEFSDKQFPRQMTSNDFYLVGKFIEKVKLKNQLQLLNISIIKEKIQESEEDSENQVKQEVEISELEMLKEYLKNTLLESYKKHIDKNIIMIPKQSVNIYNKYLERNLILSFSKINNNINRFIDIAEKYRENSNSKKQCSLCQSEFEIIDMKAEQTLEGIRVDLFSNKLKANKSDLKRNICLFCEENLLIEKKILTSSEKTRKLEDIIYLHFTPHGFLPEILEDSYRDITNKVFSSFDFMRNDFNDILLERKIDTTINKGAFLLDKDSEKNTLGNHITFPVVSSNFDKNDHTDYYSINFLKALDVSLFLLKNFNFKVYLSKIRNLLPYEQLSDIEFKFSYIPGGFENLIPQTDLDYKETEILFKRFTSIRSISLKIYNSSNHKTGKPRVIDWLINLKRIINSLSENNSYIYHLILRELKNIGVKESELILYLFKDLEVFMSADFQNKNPAKLSELVKGLLRISLKYDIKGKTESDYAINKPLDILFERLEKYKSKDVDMDGLMASSNNLLFEHLERVSDYFDKESKIFEVNEYVSYFTEKLFQEYYNTNVDKVILDRKEIIGIYSYYYKLNNAISSKIKALLVESYKLPEKPNLDEKFLQEFNLNKFEAFVSEKFKSEYSFQDNNINNIIKPKLDSLRNILHNIIENKSSFGKLFFDLKEIF